MVKDATAYLEASLIQEASNPDGHGLLLTAKPGLMGGDPINLLLGDDTCGEGFQHNLPQSHEQANQSDDGIGKPPQHQPRRKEEGKSSDSVKILGLPADGVREPSRPPLHGGSTEKPEGPLSL